MSSRAPKNETASSRSVEAPRGQPKGNSGIMTPPRDQKKRSYKSPNRPAVFADATTKFKAMVSRSGRPPKKTCPPPAPFADTIDLTYSPVVKLEKDHQSIKEGKKAFAAKTGKEQDQNAAMQLLDLGKDSAESGCLNCAIRRAEHNVVDCSQALRKSIIKRPWDNNRVFEAEKERARKHYDVAFEEFQKLCFKKSELLEKLK